MNGTIQTFRADEIIMREGDVSDEMFKILSGSVVVYMRYGEKDEHVVGIYAKSGCFGEMNLLSGQYCSYTVVAYDDVVLLRITRDSLEEFVRDNPKNVIDIMQNMAQTFVVMQKSIDLLLDDLCEKRDLSRNRTEEIKRKTMQCRIGGLDVAGRL